MLFKLFSVVALAVATVTATATPTISHRNALSLNPPSSVIPPREIPVSQIEARGLTNAKRLAAGLPLNPPGRRHAEMARAAPSAAPTLTNGYIQVRAGDSILGYVRKEQNSFSEYGTFTQDITDALLVAIDLYTASTGSADIETLNGPDITFPFLGAITGFEATSHDLGVGSFNYAYLGGTTQTPPNSPPVSANNSFSTNTGHPESIESAIFSYDAITGEITAQWINTDSTAPATYIAQYLPDGVLVLTGDKDAFIAAFGEQQFVTLFFVSA